MVRGDRPPCGHRSRRGPGGEESGPRRPALRCGGGTRPLLHSSAAALASGCPGESHLHCLPGRAVPHRAAVGSVPTGSPCGSAAELPWTGPRRNRAGSSPGRRGCSGMAHGGVPRAGRGQRVVRVPHPRACLPERERRQREAGFGAQGGQVTPSTDQSLSPQHSSSVTPRLCSQP